MCCEPLLSGSSQAQTAEALMRSRYCAHVLDKPSYVVGTYASKQRKKLNAKSIERGMRSVTWLDLKIVSILNGRQTDQTGEVEFIATYEVANQKRQMKERSFFIRENSLWRYVGPTKKK